jgi:hypothetical protein
VNTFRSVLPGRYGHGLGAVTKNRGKRNGAVTFGGLLRQVSGCGLESENMQADEFVKERLTIKGS